jgi:transcriptional regulator with XRE-family HTH domain
MQHKRCQNNLSSVRRTRRLSQKRVAALLGRSPKMLSKYERGILLPPLEVAATLSIIYQAKLEDLYPALHRELKLKATHKLLTI